MLRAPSENMNVDLLALDEALKKLFSVKDRHARIIELRFFGSLSVEATAEVMDVSGATVEKDWRVARAWLIHELSDDHL
ncbi:MAG: ECF-type sigma factor [Phycisphaerales bacterium]|nr:ECF-type sigma factor [Phycisphaerales bacterium]